MEHPASTEPHQRLGTGICLSGLLVWPELPSAIAGYDQDIAAYAAEADRVSWAAHIEEFRRVRLATISLFANMPSEGWMRTGVASDNLFTVRALAYIAAGHYAHHVRIIEERYL